MDDVPEGLDSDALAARLRVSVRTLRSWVKARALPVPPRKGHASHFDRAAIVRAHAVAALRREGVPLPLMGRYLANKSDRELRELGGLPPAPSAPAALPAPAPMAALPADSSPSSQPETRSEARALPADAAPHPSDAVVVDDPPADTPHQRAIGSAWRRVELVPGLELHVRDDAAPFVHSLAAAIASGRWAK